jgi:hypothetical protein
MSPVARGTSAGILVFVLLAALLTITGCIGIQGPGNSPGLVPSPPAGAMTPLATAPARTLPSPVPARTVPALSLPPPTAAPVQIPSVDPIVGRWYAPPPDDLTFEFSADGTFSETSPNFKPYYGTWGISGEGEEGFYDAMILDRWGFQKQVHLLVTSGTISFKSMGTLHRVE